jgi:nucleotide-binding universal stress UspA family protein
MTSMTIKGAWKGWHGQTIVEMTDGSKWKQFDADQATEVRHGAERTAAHGASLAGNAGFLARSVAVESAPTWKGIVETAGEHNASLIVLRPHRRNGLLGHLQGSVAAAVVAHSTTPVLLVLQAARQPIAPVRRLAEAAT